MIILAFVLVAILFYSLGYGYCRLKYHYEIRSHKKSMLDSHEEKDGGCR